MHGTHDPSISSSLMAPHIVSLGRNEHRISPVLSRRPSIVSLDTIPSDTRKRSLGIPEAPRAAKSRTKGAMSSSVIEPGEVRKPANECTRADDPFIPHDKYFFKDGNVTFLVRDHDVGYGGCIPNSESLIGLF